MSKVLVPISTGFEEIEALSIIDICRRAEIQVIIAGVRELEVRGAHNIKVTADAKIEDVKSDDFDMIVLPGGLPNAFNLAQDEDVQELLKQFKKEDKYVCAICAAPFALHEAEVLNQNYTCYPSFEKQIRLDGYSAENDVVVDGKVITSRGPATAMKFALELVKTLCGEKKYNEVKEGLLFK